MKCGNCHAKSSDPTSQPPTLRSPKSSSCQSPDPVALWPAAAAQPIRGGMRPTTAPTHVFIAETRFMGVYTPAYMKIFRPPRKATVGLTP